MIFTDRGPVKDHIGMDIVEKGGGFVISQERYAANLVEEYGFKDAKVKDTPLAVTTELLEKREPIISDNLLVPRKIVGQLGWLALTRPDIRFAGAALAQMQLCPTSEFFASARHVLRYLAGTTKLSITYKPTGKKQLCVTAASDASWAPNKNPEFQRKSISGSIVMVNGSPIEWFTRRQTSVAMSSGASEILAMSSCVEDALYIKRRIVEMADMVTELQIFREAERLVKAAVFRSFWESRSVYTPKFGFLNGFGRFSALPNLCDRCPTWKVKRKKNPTFADFTAAPGQRWGP